jgi:hypothetical protein
MRCSTESDTRIESLAAEQCGLFTRRQALDLGATPAQLRLRVDRREWRWVVPGVLSFAGHGPSHERSMWMAHLHAGPDSVLSHGAAGLLVGLHPIDGQPVELLVARGQSRGLAGTVRHRPRTPVDPAHIVRVRGLPTTDAPRTILDLAAQVSITRLRRIVEHAEVERVCPVGLVGARLSQRRGMGRRGTARLARVLDELGPGEGLPRSELEALLAPVLAAAGLPPALHEHPLPTTSELRGFVDRAWPHVRLIIEADGRRWHTRRADFARDARRDLEAGALGWHTQRVTWEMLRFDPDGTAALIRATYDERVRLHRPPHLTG